jgi:hypothetical protein
MLEIEGSPVVIARRSSRGFESRVYLRIFCTNFVSQFHAVTSRFVVGVSQRGDKILYFIKTNSFFVSVLRRRQCLELNSVECYNGKKVEKNSERSVRDRIAITSPEFAWKDWVKLW